MNRKLLHIEYEDVSGSPKSARRIQCQEFYLSADPEKAMNDIAAVMHDYPYQQWVYNKLPFLYRFGFYIKEDDYETLSKIINSVIQEQMHEQDFKVREISEYINREMHYLNDTKQLQSRISILKKHLQLMNYQCFKCGHTFEQETIFGHKHICCPKCKRADWALHNSCGKRSNDAI